MTQICTFNPTPSKIKHLISQVQSTRNHFNDIALQVCHDRKKGVRALRGARKGDLKRGQILGGQVRPCRGPS